MTQETSPRFPLAGPATFRGGLFTAVAGSLERAHGFVWVAGGRR